MRTPWRAPGRSGARGLCRGTAAKRSAQRRGDRGHPLPRRPVVRRRTDDLRHRRIASPRPAARCNRSHDARGGLHGVATRTGVGNRRSAGHRSRARSGIVSGRTDMEVHFRTSIEPQLAARKDHVDELYRLTHDVRWSRLAGRLAAEWLATHPDLPLPVQTALLSCALDNIPDQIPKHLNVAERVEETRDRDTMLLWLSAAFVMDFDNHSDDLHAAAADESRLLWFIRDRMGEEFQERFSRFSNWPARLHCRGVRHELANGRDAHRRHHGQSQPVGRMQVHRTDDPCNFELSHARRNRSSASVDRRPRHELRRYGKARPRASTQEPGATSSTPLRVSKSFGQC